MQPTNAFPVARFFTPVVTCLIAFALSGCTGVLLGNFLVLGLTFVVFFGTLGLGRARPPTVGPSSGSADQSQSDV